ncbi:MAG TPA: glycosyl hydrolase [Solirubrobacterales bacterium]|nr:glycosyl hydrolase [Solirubrobacterales bacterium]
MRTAAGAAVAVCALTVLAPSVAVTPSAATAATGGAPSISFHVPPEARAGKRIAARGRVAGLDGRAAIQAQLRRNGHWRPLATVATGSGRFVVTLRLPKRGRAAILRGAILLAGRRVATSAPRRVRLAQALRPRRTTPSTPPSTSTASPAATAASLPIPPGHTLPPSGPLVPAEPEPEPPVEPGPEPPIKPAASLYWGAWIDPGTSVQPAPVNETAISQFEAIAGKRPSVLESYSAFFQCSDGSGGACSGEYAFPEEQLEAIRQRGAIPLFSWASESSSGQIEQSNFQLADVAAGGWDAYITKWAEAAKAWRHPFFLRFDWEMNGTWFPWGRNVNGNQPGEYVAAWRHVHDIFTAVGATNATWVWCPFVTPKVTPALGLYPGDEYVDWTCLDGYNTHTGAWRSFSEIFKPSYDEITKNIAPTKPMLLAEFASAEENAPEGSSKAQWITEMFAALPTEFPLVRGLLWFNYDEREQNGERKEWPLKPGSDAAAAFATGISDPGFAAGSDIGPILLP